MQAHEAVDLLKAGDISPRELLEAAFARIAQTSPDINATVVTCPERAFAAPDDLNTAESGAPGWLAGLPIGIKDLNNVAGVRTTYGNLALKDFVPKDSDPLVLRLESRGAIVTGKTNTPEFGAGGNTFNDVYGATRNPWDTTLNAGGSSGGAAASLAAGEVWLSHGSDHGGSLRTPAAYCGIVGLRPSPGVAGGAGKDIAFHREGVQGPMARSVRDCALFLDAMAGFDPLQPIAFPAPATPYQDAVQRAEPKLRIAFSPDLNGLSPVDAEMDAHLRGALARMEGAGAVVEEIQPELPDLERTYHTLRGQLWASLVRNLPPAARESYKQTLEENTRFGESLTIDDVIAADLGRSALFHKMCDLFTRFDVLACPVVGNMPRPQSEEWVREVGGQPLAGYMDWLRFAFLATTCGLPAISVPVGLGPRGLPVGLQLIGQPRGEAALLAAAQVVETVMGGPLGPIDPNVTHR